MSERPYQTKALTLIRENFSKGINRVLLKLATGSGKTVVFCSIVKAVERKGKKAVVVVRGKELVEQASKRLFRENVHHGVMMANHWNKKPSAAVQVCSIDTLIARKQFPKADLLVIDEAHLFTSQKCRDFMLAYQDSFVLAVTATPYTREPLSHLAQTVVAPITTQELIDQGYLVDARYFAPSAPDMKGVKVEKGDFSNIQSEERMSGLTGDIVAHWKTLAQGRSTVCFAVNIHHSLTIRDQFLAAGIPSEHMEGDTPASDRAEMLKRLEKGETKVICNVGVLCTGVDIPHLGCIIMARPTKSYNLYIQQLGRGTRPFPGKDHFLVLDHAGNTLRHGFITQERDVDLAGRVKEKIEGLTPKICKQCFGVFTSNACPDCPPLPIVEKERIILENDGILEELRHLPVAAEVSIFIAEKKEIAKRRGFKKGWVYYQTVSKFGEEIANAAFPKKFVPPWIKRTPR